jgi:hypothetical protein
MLIQNSLRHDSIIASQRLAVRVLQHNQGVCGHEFLRQGRDGPIGDDLTAEFNAEAGMSLSKSSRFSRSNKGVFFEY